MINTQIIMAQRRNRWFTLENEKEKWKKIKEEWHRTHSASDPRWWCFMLPPLWTPPHSINCFHRGRKQAACLWYWWVRRERELPCTQLLLWFPRETAVEAAEEKEWVGRQWFGTHGSVFCKRLARRWLPELPWWRWSVESFHVLVWW